MRPFCCFERNLSVSRITDISVISFLYCLNNFALNKAFTIQRPVSYTCLFNLTMFSCNCTVYRLTLTAAGLLSELIKNSLIFKHIFLFVKLILISWQVTSDLSLLLPDLNVVYRKIVKSKIVSALEDQHKEPFR
jgi:hypothetical protein